MVLGHVTCLKNLRFGKLWVIYYQNLKIFTHQIVPLKAKSYHTQGVVLIEEKESLSLSVLFRCYIFFVSYIMWVVLPMYKECVVRISRVFCWFFSKHWHCQSKRLLIGLAYVNIYIFFSILPIYNACLSDPCHCFRLSLYHR